MSKIFNRFKKDRADRLSNLPATRGESSDESSASALSQHRAEPPTHASASQHPQPADKIGLFELAKEKHDVEKTIDVVAVHGLQGDAYQTWTHENGTMWLESILPDKIPYARVMTFGYNSTIAFSSSEASLEDKSLELINRLTLKRSSVENGSTRPIVFVCHSLGGILVKKALILAHERSSDAHCRNILDNTKAIAFLGVPHRGSDAAWWSSFAASSLKGATLGMSTHTALVKDLQTASPTLATISRQFIDRGQPLKIYTFYETRKLSGIVVVDKQSALLNLPNEKLFSVDANHRTICKISSAESQEFEAVGAWIEDLVRSVAPHTSPNMKVQSYFEVPNRRVSHFFGRKDIISKIDQALSVGPGPHVAVLRGIGGQGKSQLAMEYCHRKKDGPFPDIFWIDATSENSVMSTFISISGLISTAADPLLDNNARIAFVSRKFASWPTGLLLVFDNYDDPHEFPNIRDFFPPNKLSSILVTGRHADIGTLVLGQDTNLIELSGLDHIAAVDLLEHHSQVKETNSKFGEEIVRRLGYHPLAITQAGTYIRKGGIPLSEFADIYKQEKEEILKNTPQLSQYRRKLGDTEKETSLNVFTTWQLSFQQLLSHTSEDSIAVKLLRLLAFFDNKDISEWIFIEFQGHSAFASEISKLLEWLNRFTNSQKRWNHRSFKKALDLLYEFCLLQSVAQDSDGKSHASLHPLVKDWVQLQMGKSACQQYALMATEILGDILREYWESKHFQLPLQTKRYLALHVIAQEDNNSEYLGINFAELNRDLIIEHTNNQSWFARFIRNLGLYNKAEPLHVQVLETRKRVLGTEHPNTLTSMNNLALIYGSQGRWEEAEPLQVQVLETRKRVLGTEHPNTLTSMNNLASIYRDQGRWEEAEPLQVQVLETKKRVLGTEHPSTLSSMDNLASTYWDQDRWEEAEVLQVQVLETRKRVQGSEHPDTLTSMNNMTYTWKRRGRYSEAHDLMEECMQLRTRILGKNHPDTLSSSTTLLKWQAENLRLASKVEESPAFNHVAS